MALKDVKQYYINMLNQYVEIKNDMSDFEQGLKDGYITEEQLAEAKADVERLKANVDRLTYIMYLFELPNKKAKKIKYKNFNTKLESYFVENGADEQSIIDENKSVIAHFKSEMTNLKNSTN